MLLLQMTQTVIDQIGFPVTFHSPPERIISLVPSQTELLADLGLDNQVVGISRYCIHPSNWLYSKTVIGGTKKFDFDIIDSLQPDLIVGNKEENYKEGIEKLKEKYPVWMSDIVTIEDAVAMIRSVGEITDRQRESAVINEMVQSSLHKIKPLAPATVLYLIWRKPWMAAGKDTFVDTMLGLLGLKNILRTQRYPEVSLNEIKGNPDYIFLSSEPYPFKEKHIEEVREIFPESKPILVDGEMFSWFGSRLKYVPEYFNNLRSVLTDSK